MTVHYRTFGFTIASSRSLVPLQNAMIPPLSHTADIVIEEGHVPTVAIAGEMPDMRFGFDGTNCLIEVDEVGRFSVSRNRIVVERRAGVTDCEIDAYLLGTAFGALLHLRGRLPIHCNAVEVDGAAVLFCGASGAGKSTLAAHYASKGRIVLTDDLCAVEPLGDRFVAHPGIPRLKLWLSAVEHLDIVSEGARPVPWCDSKIELPNPSERSGSALPIAAIYHLPHPGKAPVDANLIEPLSTLPAINAITANIYRRTVADVTGQSLNYLQLSARLAANVPVFQINRKWGFERFDGEAEFIAAHMDSVGRALDHHWCN